MQTLERIWNKALHCSFAQFLSTRRDHWMPIVSMYPDIVYVQCDALMAGIIDLRDGSMVAEGVAHCWIPMIHWMLLVLLWSMIHDCCYEVMSHRPQIEFFSSWKMNVMLLVIHLVEAMKNVVVDLMTCQSWDEDDG